MGIKVYKPTTAGRRNSSVDDFSDLTKGKPEKGLTVALRRQGGRNNQGKITVHQRGGGHKRRYRLVDFKRQKFDQEAVIKALEYDPNRNTRIALIEYADQTKAYILAPQTLKVGDKVVSSQQKVEVKVANRMPLKYIPAGMMVYELELTPGRGGQIVRSAGMGAVIMAQENNLVQLKMPSGEIRNFFGDCSATIGQASNPEWRHVRWGKAGRMRWLGRRPKVRGKAMNPVDHPHGGGEGNQPIGLKHPKTPTGKPALGVKTRDANKYSNKFILARRKKRKHK